MEHKPSPPPPSKLHDCKLTFCDVCMYVCMYVCVCMHVCMYVYLYV